MAKQAKSKKTKSTKAPKSASVPKVKSAKKGAKATKPKSAPKAAELATTLSAVESSVAQIKSQIEGFESVVAGLVQRLEADRKALEDRLVGALADALSPFKSQLLVPLQQEVSSRLDSFGRQLSELAKAIEPGSGHR